jgi:hypothetical protein
MNRQAILGPVAAASMFLATVGCGGPRLDEGRCVDEPALRTRLVQRAASVYPGSFRMVHRVLLAVAGREFDFTGYCLVKRPSMVRAVGMSELGGTAFDVISKAPHHAVTADESSDRLSRLLREGVVRTVRALFLEYPSEESYVVTYEDGTVGLLEFSRDGPVSVMHFDANTGAPLRRVTAERGRIVSEIAYGNWRSVPGNEGDVPARLSVIDHKHGYRVDVDHISMSAEDLPDSYFTLDEAADAESSR